MKKNTYILIVILLVSIIWYGCAPKSWNYAQQEATSGNNVAAIYHIASTLKEEPNYSDAIKLLQEILPVTFRDIYDKAQSSQNLNDWDSAVQYYLKIEEINNIIGSIAHQKDEETGKFITFERMDISKNLADAKEKAAELHYQNGQKFEQTSKFKEAAKEYSKALEFSPGYKDASERYDVNRSGAVQRVAIMNFENKSGKGQFGDLGDNVSAQSISFAMSSSKNMEFLEFVTRDRLSELMAEKELGDIGQLDDKTASNAGKVLGIHSFVFGKIISVITNTPPEIITKVQQNGQVYNPKTQKNVPVSALVTVKTRKASATVKCTYQIINVAKGTIVKSGTIEGIENQEIKFGGYTGDEAALDSYHRLLCSTDESYPPSEDELVSKAIEVLSAKLAKELVTHFN